MVPVAVFTFLAAFVPFVLLAVVVGGAALGVAGSVLAVPVTAIVINVIDELHPAAELTTGDDE